MARGKYHLRTCRICHKDFYTTARQSKDRCINHLRKPMVKSGFIGFWSKELRTQLQAKKFPFDPKETVLRKMLGK